MLLAIETSCDDTAAAVLDGRKVLSNCIANQNLIHKAYGGIVPELASRAHQSKIVPVITQALVEANIDKKQLTAIAYTQGPGLLGSLLVGGSFAKSMALALDLPLIPVNHMHAHLLVHFIEGNLNPEFPFLGITLSGGHTQLILVKSYFNFELIGTTLDDAIGEAFDKCGKIMGLSYPAGQEIDKLAKNGDKQKFSFPIANPKGYNLSYSGIKTAFINFIKNEETKNPKFIKKNIAIRNIKQFDYFVVSPSIKIDKNHFLFPYKNKIIIDLDFLTLELKKQIIIGITGTEGKSTTCQYLSQTLSRKYKNII